MKQLSRPTNLFFLLAYHHTQARPDGDVVYRRYIKFGASSNYGRSSSDPLPKRGRPVLSQQTHVMTAAPRQINVSTPIIFSFPGRFPNEAKQYMPNELAVT
jgi:hypothetical protein